jgi:hypothetical protein
MKQTMQSLTQPMRGPAMSVGSVDGGASKRRLRWRRWRVATIEEPERLTSAELSECTCPDLCQRDHDHD